MLMEKKLRPPNTFRRVPGFALLIVAGIIKARTRVAVLVLYRWTFQQFIQQAFYTQILCIWTSEQLGCILATFTGKDVLIRCFLPQELPYALSVLLECFLQCGRLLHKLVYLSWEHGLFLLKIGILQLLLVFLWLMRHQDDAMHTVRYRNAYIATRREYKGIPLYQTHIGGGICLVGDENDSLSHCVTPVLSHYSTMRGGTR